MSDEIVSTLGFSCKDALDQLAKMDQMLEGMGERFNDLGTAMSSWNSRAEATVTILKDLATYASSAASAMGKLNANMNKAGGQAAAPPPAPEPAKSKLWLPPDVQADIDKTKDSIKPLNEVLDDGQKKAGGFTVSLQMLSRIVITQAIVRAISGIRDAMSEAITSAMDFQKRISELNSIMASPKESMDGLKSSIAGLATEFNFPLAQVAEAEYQAVSAQFVTTAQRADVMTASLKLAKIGVMELNTATNLITGALNAYGLDSSQATLVAAKFFQTIQDGRVRGEELAASLGKVLPVAAELGVSIDEVNSAMVQLTVAGVKAPEAATSIRSSMMALIKPSADMKKALHDAFGMDSGEQMIGAYGYQGALDKLRDSTDGTIAEFVKLIPNVRGINAGLRETGSNAEKAAAELERMHAASAESMNKAYKIFIDTNAEKVSAELNKLQVWLTTELGPTLLQGVSSVLAFAGGTSTLTSAISALAGPITVVVAGLALWGVGAGAAAAQTALLSVEMTGLNAALGVAGVALIAYFAGSFIDNKLHAAMMKARQDFEKQAAEDEAAADAKRQAKTTAADESNKEIGQRIKQEIAEISKAYNALVDSTKEADKAMEESAKTSMEAMVATKEKEANLLKDLAKECEKAIEDSHKRINNILAEKEDKQFEFKQKHDNAGATAHQREDESMANKLAREGEKEMANAKSPEDLAKAENAFKRAESYAKMAISSAQTTGNVALEKEAEGTLLGIMDQRLKGEKEFDRLKEAQRQEAAQAAGVQKSEGEEMRTLMKDINKESALFDAKGNPLKADMRAKNEEKAMQDKAKFFKLFGDTSFDASPLLNFPGLHKKMEDAMKEGVTTVQIDSLIASPAAIHGFNKQINDGLDISKAYQKFAPGVDMSAMSPTEMREAADKATDAKIEQADKINKANDAIASSEEKIGHKVVEIEGQMQISYGKTARFVDSVKTVASALPAGVTKIWDFFAGNENKTLGVGDFADQFGKIENSIKFLTSHHEAATPDAYTDLLAKVNALNANAPMGMGNRTESLTLQLKDLKDVVDQEEKLKALRAGKDKMGEEGSKAQDYLNSQKNLHPEPIIPKMSDEEIKANLLKTTQDILPAFINGLAAAAAQMDKIAASSQAIKMPTVASQNGMTAAHGGTAWNFLASGGESRGTDTHHAMLSDGEMVINANSARKFSSQLTAMNAGVRPSYHTHGGSVTNVGDINVSVHGSGSDRNMGRTVATEIRRELRRGSSTLS
jgi:TP901 family phage tail tape measure protein